MNINIYEFKDKNTKSHIWPNWIWSSEKYEGGEDNFPETADSEPGIFKKFPAESQGDSYPPLDT